uniref:Fibronectin type-III domain-containing protein n=1 Tax=Amphimedon queenslandica TaxID=400682 RepID=A0A1X7TV04_AMPQE
MIVIFFILLSSSIYVSLGTVSLNQSSPLYDIVCPGDTLVFTCITNYQQGVAVVWNINTMSRTLLSNSVLFINGFVLNITALNNTASKVTSTASVNVSAPSHLNGTIIRCSGDGVHFSSTLTVHIAGVPVSVINIKIIPINNNTVLMNWYYGKNDEVHCIQYYNITIISDDNINGHMISNESSATIPSLIIGTNYSFIIIPIDTIGREGPPSSLIQYIWNVPAQVVNISWDQISTDSITIWWNNIVDMLHYPPVHYIISIHNITINTTDTNVTINGLYPNNEYTVYIKPVNAIGEGLLINITVSVIESLSDTIISSSDDRSTLMSISLTIIDDTLVSEPSSSIEPSTISSCTSVTSQSTSTGCIISVAIALPITGLLTGLITSIITSIIVYCIMKNKGNTLRERSPVDIGPIYDLPTINNEQQEQVIDTTPNTAYGQI